MGSIDIAIYAAIPVCTAFVGYAIGKMKAEGLQKRNDALRSLLDGQHRVMRNALNDALNDALTIGAERNALQAQADRARSKLSEAGRAGALKSNAARAERRKDSAGTTIKALAHADLRPRDVVVAGVADARKAKKISGGAVASTTGG